MYHRSPSAAALAVLLALGACSSSGGSGTDTSEYAGLWDASEPLADGGTDERYVAISADGGYTEYDYRQDGAASDGNCYRVTAQRLRSIGTREEQPEIPDSEGGVEIDPDGSLTEYPIFTVTGRIPTYRLDDGRAISFFVNYSSDEDGALTDEDPVVLIDDDSAVPGALIPSIGEGRVVPSNLYWPAVRGLSIEDLIPCDDV